MEDITGIVILVGNYGSGKTEVAVNLAVDRKRAGMHVRLADLDLVNPYFRSREARGRLADLGIELILPPRRFLHADLPVLDPAVSGAIRSPGQLVLLDVGGDDVGATVLASLSDALSGKEIRMLQVVNPFRPFTETIEGCMEVCRRIESASRLRMSGIIGNAHLIDETTVDHIYRGYDFFVDLSEKSGLPLKLIAVSSALVSEIDFTRFSCPVLFLKRQLVPPWKKAVPLAG